MLVPMDSQVPETNGRVAKKEFLDPKRTVRFLKRLECVLFHKRTYYEAIFHTKTPITKRFSASDQKTNKSMVKLDIPDMIPEKKMFCWL